MALSRSEWLEKNGFVMNPHAIASGAYGVVHRLGPFRMNGKLIETSFIKILYGLYGGDESDREELEPLHEELDYCERMGNLEIGPTVYKTDIVRNDDTKDLEGVIVMEAFDRNLSKYEELCDNHEREWVAPLLQLFTDMTNSAMVCFDLKAQNVVVNGYCHIEKMRLIDFGVFCNNRLVIRDVRAAFHSRQEASSVLCALMLILFDATRTNPVFTSQIKKILYSNKEIVVFLKNLFSTDKNIISILGGPAQIQWSRYAETRKKSRTAE